MKLSDYQPEQKHMLCFVGKGGHGKSIGASFWPTPMYYASCDGRVASIYNYWKTVEPGRLNDIEFDTYTATDYDKLATKLENLQMRNPFKTVILDPLTMIGDMLIRYSMAQTRGDSKNEKKQDKGRVQISGPDDYKTETHGLKLILDIGRVLKSHFILCAHILEDSYYELGSDKPRVTRKLLTAGKQPAAMIPGMFDEVWLFTVVPAATLGLPPEYKVITRPTAEFDALRTSVPAMPTEFKWTKDGPNGTKVPMNLYAMVSKLLNAPVEKKGGETADVGVPAPPSTV
jgi:hypothetical protein